MLQISDNEEPAMTTRMHYRDELELVRQHLIQMGETTIHVYSEALGGIGK
jgi:hypothetical protein